MLIYSALQVISSTFTTKVFIFGQKCSLSDIFCLFGGYPPKKAKETMDFLPCRNENFLPDFQAVTRKFKKKFAPN